MISSVVCGICHSPSEAGTGNCKTCGAPLAAGAKGGSQHLLTPGTRLNNGQYSVGRVLGQGGFGITYQGSEVLIRRLVAIKEFFPSGSTRRGTKVLSSTGASAKDFLQMRARFLEEARNVARFEHPNMVQVYAAFEENDSAYMVMEFLKGRTLGDMLTGGRGLPTGEVIEYLRGIASALQKMHERGLLHRDLKPDNIVVTEEGRSVLIDFGAAREFASQGTSRMTQLVTEGYAPLEQYTRSAHFGPPTDIYSLAATFYHAMTGELPPTAPDRAMGAEVRPAHQVAPAVPKAVSDVVGWALEMDARKRPQTVQEFLAALDAGAMSGGAGTTASSDSDVDWMQLLAQMGPIEIPEAPSPASITSHLQNSVISAAPGATLELGSGVHDLDGPLIVDKSLVIRGNGSSTTILRSSSGGVLALLGSGCWTIENIGFEFAGPEAGDVVYQEDGEATFQRCSFRNGRLVGSNGGTGVFLAGRAKARILGCLASGNQHSGIYAGDNCEILVQDTCCVENGQSGIELRNHTRGTVLRNECLSNSRAGIYVGEEAVGSVQQNRCTENGAGGIVFSDSSQGDCTRNEAVRNSGVGVAVLGHARPHVEENVCKENEDGGMALSSDWSIAAIRNHCLQNRSHGLVLLDQGQAFVVSNVCADNAGNGLACVGTTVARVAENTVRSNQSSGILLTDSARGVVIGNHVERNGQCGITVSSTATVELTRNVCKANTMHGIYADGQVTVTIEGNIIEESTQSGIALFEQARAEIRENSSSGNRLNGLYLQWGVSARLQANRFWNNQAGDVLDERHG